MFDHVDKVILSDTNINSSAVVVKDDVFSDCVDDVLSDILNLRNADSQLGTESIFQHAGIGKGITNQVNTDYRGDLRCWVTPDLCRDHKLRGIEKLVKNLIRSCSHFKADHRLNGDYSVQLTLYPGNGSRYVKHLDTFSDLSNNTTSGSSAKPTIGKSTRRLTFLYYLNKECNGGALRVHNHHSRSSSSTSNELDSYTDIEPKLGRLVVFRSDKVEHEVLPCFSDRIAISMWASCDSVSEGDCGSSSSSSSNSENSDNKGKGTGSVSSAAAESQSVDHSILNPLPLPPLHIIHNEHVSAGDHCTANCVELDVKQDAEEDTCRIFVSMINYRDSEGPRTIADLLCKASLPGRIFVGEVFQGDAERDKDCVFVSPTEGGASVDSDKLAGFDFSAHVRRISMSASQAKGPCFARHLAVSLWAGEEFFLQIDSHMRFRPGWDRFLIRLLNIIKKEETFVPSSSGSGSSNRKYVKPVITTYPLGYTLPNNVPNDTRPTVLVPTKFDEDGILRQTAKIVSPVTTAAAATTGAEENSRRAQYLRSPLWASGFSFCESSAVLEAPYSPLLDYLFFGEEVYMAARLFTHGYDFFAPTEAVLYHLYSRAHRPTFQEVQPAGREAARRRSQCTVRDMLGMGDVAGGSAVRDVVESGEANNLSSLIDEKYGLGAVRSLSDFEASIGVDFKSRVVYPRDWNAYINSSSSSSSSGSTESSGDGISVSDSAETSSGWKGVQKFEFLSEKVDDPLTHQLLQLSGHSSAAQVSAAGTTRGNSGGDSAAGILNMLQQLQAMDRVKQFLS